MARPARRRRSVSKALEQRVGTVEAMRSRGGLGHREPRGRLPAAASPPPQLEAPLLAVDERAAHQVRRIGFEARKPTALGAHASEERPGGGPERDAIGGAPQECEPRADGLARFSGAARIAARPGAPLTQPAGERCPPEAA